MSPEEKLDSTRSPVRSAVAASTVKVPVPVSRVGLLRLTAMMVSPSMVEGKWDFKESPFRICTEAICYGVASKLRR